MEIIVALLFVAGVLFGADRLMLLLESHGHVRWRRTGRRRLSEEPTARLDSMLSDHSRR
ncbi:hypothetical protein Nocox_31920 [Nonomuraea coxensis DSM 45129]|uniref:Uncharacterized protein n=1 Tax=Nonomuraea coxensis DSM 45129 TaxID=1122611 RepID=A0ABX8U856_9ACTN|nr:hypothetical protein [Nonomuraea coxensis]QYC43960.1 hypothetical protein Nocox_31920 [Nonomuraea coxensis DSM 45129]